MISKTLSPVVAFLLLCAGHALAQAPDATPATALPAASRSDIECSGFISDRSLPADVQVFDGADNDFRSPYRQFIKGAFVYLNGPKNAPAVGTEYRLIRPAIGSLIFQGDLLPIFGRATWYSGQDMAIRALGQAYEDIGRAKVAAVTPHGAVAQVTFACQPAAPGDLAIPFEPRQIPTYDPTIKFDRFAPITKGEKRGTITAAAGNAGALANGSLVYLNLGAADGARSGQRYRIFHVDRRFYWLAWRTTGTPPTETIGELVVLFTQEKSSVGIVISNLREIDLGDGIVPE